MDLSLENIKSHNYVILPIFNRGKKMPHSLNVYWSIVDLHNCVSDVQQSEPVIHTYISTPFKIFFPHRSLHSTVLYSIYFIYAKWSEVTQTCLTLCDPMDSSLPGSFIHGIFQARVLEWVAISFSRESSQPRDWTWVSCIAGRRFTVWATREAFLFYI